MWLKAISTYHPVKMTVLFFISAFILLTDPFWNLSKGLNYVGIVLHYGLIFYIVFKAHGLELYKEYGAIINNAIDFKDLQLYTDHFVKDERYKKINSLIYVAIVWALFSVVSIFIGNPAS
jgi:hypothetical protein